MAIYDDMMKKMLLGMSRPNNRGLLTNENDNQNTGGITGLLGNIYSKAKEKVQDPRFMEQLALINAGFRGKGLQEAMRDREQVRLMRAKREDTKQSSGRLVDVFDTQTNKNIKIDENIVRQFPDRFLSKKSAGEIEKAATRTAVLGSIDNLKKQVNEQGSGLFEGFVKGLGAETGMNADYAKFKADTKQLELNVIKALRGAQVSAAEESNVRKILPSIYDSESVYKAKLDSLKEYLQTIDVQIKGGSLRTKPNNQTTPTPRKKKDEDPLGIL